MIAQLFCLNMPTRPLFGKRTKNAYLFIKKRKFLIHF